MNSRPLKIAREQRGWSQLYIADALGITVRTVSRWEQGKARPYPYYREKLCSLFNLSPSELGLLSNNELKTLDQQAQQKASFTPTSSLINHRDNDSWVPALLDPAIPSLLGRSEHLLGRVDLLQQLKSHLFDDNGLAFIALNGLPGIGKTALAAALATDPDVQRHFIDGVLWVGLGPQPRVLTELTRWGTLLGLQPNDLEQSDQPDIWSRALRAIIGTRRFLLILDDVWNLEDAFLFQIGGPGCAHVITTRQPALAYHFAQKGTFSIPELSEADSLALLTRYVPSLPLHNLESARRLVHTVGGLPLELTLIGRYLASQSLSGQPNRLQRALSQLDDAQQRLSLTVPLSPLERSPSVPLHIPFSLQAAIASSDQQLSPQAHACLLALAVFPPKPSSFSEEVALAVSAQPPEALDELWDAGLIESSGCGRYTLHQTIFDYARTRADFSKWRMMSKT